MVRIVIIVGASTQWFVERLTTLESTEIITLATTPQTANHFALNEPSVGLRSGENAL